MTCWACVGEPGCDTYDSSTCFMGLLSKYLCVSKRNQVVPLLYITQNIVYDNSSAALISLIIHWSTGRNRNVNSFENMANICCFQPL